MEKICLAQFAVSYETFSKIQDNIEFGNDGASITKRHINQFGANNYLPKFIEIDSGGFMKLQNLQSTLRIYSFKKKKGDESIYSELPLFLNWIDEKILRENCIDTFNKNYDIVEKNKKSLYQNSPMIDVTREMIENLNESRLIHVFDIDG